MEKKVGDYLIVQELKEGPLAKTLLVENRYTRKAFLLKKLPPELGREPAFAEKFQKWAPPLSELDHPTIARMHTISRIDGDYYLVLAPPHSKGALGYLSEVGRLEEKDILKVAESLASALDLAHSQKPAIMHHSLSPSTILFLRKAEDFEIYLTDLALVSLIGLEAVVARSCMSVLAHLKAKDSYAPYLENLQESRSLSEAFCESYSYLAPEQRHLKPAGAPADIYSFGLVLYRLLAGRLPEGLFALPSSLPRDLKYDWDRLMACLDPDPEKRPRTLSPLIEELKNSAGSERGSSTEGVHALKESLLGDLRERELKMAPPHSGGGTSRIQVAQFQSVIKESVAVLDSAVRSYAPERKQQPFVEPLLTEMRVIKEGEYLRGSSEGSRDELPQHKIYLSSFAIDIHPVTNEQFIRFLEVVALERDVSYNDLIRFKDSRISRSAGRFIIETGYSKHPAAGITWYGAAAYAEWVGKRLPSEAEWEIAAQGGQLHPLFPTGGTLEKHQANFFSSDTTVVMSYPPNGYGLYDMAGNVYEWCEDWYGYNYYESSKLEPNNPKGPAQGVYRVLRGGCWKSLKEDLRCSHRHRNNPAVVNGTYGFRCALSK